MRTATLCISSRNDLSRRALEAFGGKQQDVRIAFASVDLLWETLTRDRWLILQAMTGQQSLSKTDIAKRIGRNVGLVNEDVEALVLSGLLDQDKTGRVIFPYDSVRVDFQMTSAMQDAVA